MKIFAVILLTAMISLAAAGYQKDPRCSQNPYPLQVPPGHPQAKPFYTFVSGGCGFYFSSKRIPNANQFTQLGKCNSLCVERLAKPFGKLPILCFNKFSL